jgi:hypothetical protein
MIARLAKWHTMARNNAKKGSSITSQETMHEEVEAEETEAILRQYFDEDKELLIPSNKVTVLTLMFFLCSVLCNNVHLFRILRGMVRTRTQQPRRGL